MSKLVYLAGVNLTRQSEVEFTKDLVLRGIINYLCPDLAMTSIRINKVGKRNFAIVDLRDMATWRLGRL